MPKIAGSNMITVEDCTTVMLSTDSALQATTSAQERIDVGTFAWYKSFEFTDFLVHVHAKNCWFLFIFKSCKNL